MIRLLLFPRTSGRKAQRCEEIFSIQAMGLKKRLKHTGCKNVTVGISGGLDSTLALLVTARAFDLLGIDRSSITAVTMPCFGTTDRTYKNACELHETPGSFLKRGGYQESGAPAFFRISVTSEEDRDVTYENCQARERTQVLMDIANQSGGMVIGTGDMSELALGWATYNGDHMSMYGVNASVPKTLVRHLVRYYADTCEDERAECRAAGYSGYAGESGASSAQRWKDCSEDRGSGGTLRASRFLSYTISCVSASDRRKSIGWRFWPLRELMIKK